MKTKEEVIKEAWSNKELNLKDGWLYIGYCCNGWGDVSECLKGMEMSINRHNYNLDFYDHDNGDWGSVSIRPKSISGIENNNGWIKVESEEDLPKDGMTYYLICVDNKPSIHPHNLAQIKSLYIDGIIIHYQPIVKPLPPLY